MVEIIGFVAVIAAVYAAKAASIALKHDELVANCASFSWASAREEDLALAESWSVEEETAPEARTALGTLRPAHGIGA